MENKKEWDSDSDVKWKKTKKFSKKWKSRLIYEETSSMHSFLKKSISSLLDNTKRKDKPLDETFSSMCHRLGYDDSYLKERYSQLVIESRGMYVLALMSVFVTTYSIGVLDYYVIMSSVIISCMFIFSGFVKAFRAWQINSKNMGSFSDWCHQYEDWIV